MSAQEAIEAIEIEARTALALMFREGPVDRDALLDPDWLTELVEDLRDRGWVIEEHLPTDRFVVVAEPLDFAVALRLVRVKKKRARPRRRKAVDAAQIPWEGAQ